MCATAVMLWIVPETERLICGSNPGTDCSHVSVMCATAVMLWRVP